jgi:hypothetical protein
MSEQAHLSFLCQLPCLLKQALLLLHGAHQGAVQPLIQLLGMLSPLTADVANLNKSVNDLQETCVHSAPVVAAACLQGSVCLHSNDTACWYIDHLLSC